MPKYRKIPLLGKGKFLRKKNNLPTTKLPVTMKLKILIIILVLLSVIADTLKNQNILKVKIILVILLTKTILYL